MDLVDDEKLTEVMAEVKKAGLIRVLVLGPVLGFGLRVWDFLVWGLGSWNWGFGFWVHGWVKDLGLARV